MYHAHGKLLLTGEYFVLDGAAALAVPTKRGQQLQAIAPMEADELRWQSLNQQGDTWFWGHWQRRATHLELVDTNEAAVAERFGQLLTAIQAQGTEALDALFGQHWQSQLEFPRDWGLGSSSTLISLLAQVTGTNPYTLLADSFGGSGYDLACAEAETPIVYQLANAGEPTVKPLDWSPAYASQLCFVHLGRKQNSREGIRMYRELGGAQVTLIDEISALTQAFIAANELTVAAEVALAHESLVSEALQIPRAQTLYFSDFPGVIKSLGAWGGDFVLVFSEKEPSAVRRYFHEREYQTVLSWDEMIRG